jgi:hypothetical protein
MPLMTAPVVAASRLHIAESDNQDITPAAVACRAYLSIGSNGTTIDMSDPPFGSLQAEQTPASRINRLRAVKY